MYNSIPKIGSNIQFSKFSDSEYLLHEINYNHYIKISKEVYNLLSIIDGKKNINDIKLKYNEKFNLELSEEFIYNLLYKKLQPYGLLEGNNENLKKYEKPKYLKLSFIIFNAKLLQKITPHFKFFFKTKISIFILISCTLIISGCLFKHFDLYSDFNLRDSLIYFLILMAFSTTFHEIGHATSASYFGAKHGGIGGGFYLFTPVYFADVTDVWRLPRKQRIIVNLAGMYFEFIFCSFIVLLALFIFNEPFVAVLASIICIKTLNNLNPFLRSDGYWILSDIINKPNLMAHAGKKVLSIFSKQYKKWKLEDYVLFTYGLLSFTVMGLFLYFVLFINPNSILLFPENLATFIKTLFSPDATTSFETVGQLIIPLIFFILVYNLVKQIFKQKKYNKNTHSIF